MRVFIIFTSCLVLSVQSTTDELPECNKKEKLIIEKCDSIRNELSSYTHEIAVLSNSERTPEKVKILTDLCETSEECLARVNCKEADELKTFVRTVCDLVYYHVEDNRDCINGFYKEAYLADYTNSNSCLKKFKYFDENLTKRKEAYINGKSCLKDHIRKTCSKSAQDFFTKKYKVYVDHVTIKPDQGLGCEHKPFYFLHTARCNQIMIEVAHRVMKVGELRLEPDDPSIKNILRMCFDMLTCFEQPCAGPNYMARLYENCALLEEGDWEHEEL